MISLGTVIHRIKPASPASRANLKSGDRIVSCNDSPVNDWVDLLAMSSCTKITLRITRGPLRRTVKLHRRPGVEWGIDLAGTPIRSCRNSCIFCFVDQQPDGLRKSLLVKDDDVRYSFLSGTYITLTEQQTNEAIRRGFTSLHVSVHTTDPILRGRMLGLPEPLNILPQIDRLEASGIEVQAQVVEVPGWNDSSHLDNTISDLYKRSNVQILGVVPVGLTCWRKGLEPLRRHTKSEAERTLELIEKWQKKAESERGIPWIFAADEYYSISGKEIPSSDLYDTSTLAANGIGLLAEMLSKCKDKVFTGHGLIITGLLAAPYISKLLSGSGYRVVGVENSLMGPMVGVAGLLSGKDVVDSIKKHSTQDEIVFLPGVMFNHSGVTLDELSLQDICNITGKSVFTENSIGGLN